MTDESERDRSVTDEPERSESNPVVDLTTTIRADHRLFIEFQGINVAYELKRLLQRRVRRSHIQPQYLRDLVSRAHSQGYSTAQLRDWVDSLDELERLVQGQKRQSVRETTAETETEADAEQVEIDDSDDEVDQQALPSEEESELLQEGTDPVVDNRPRSSECSQDS